MSTTSMASDALRSAEEGMWLHANWALDRGQMPSEAPEFVAYLCEHPELAADFCELEKVLRLEVRAGTLRRQPQLAKNTRDQRFKGRALLAACAAVLLVVLGFIEWIPASEAPHADVVAVRGADPAKPSVAQIAPAASRQPSRSVFGSLEVTATTRTSTTQASPSAQRNPIQILSITRTRSAPLFSARR